MPNHITYYYFISLLALPIDFFHVHYWWFSLSFSYSLFIWYCYYWYVRHYFHCRRLLFRHLFLRFLISFAIHAFLTCHWFISFRCFLLRFHWLLFIFDISWCCHTADGFDLDYAIITLILIILHYYAIISLITLLMPFTFFNYYWYAIIIYIYIIDYFITLFIYWLLLLLILLLTCHFIGFIPYLPILLIRYTYYALLLLCHCFSLPTPLTFSLLFHLFFAFIYFRCH